MLNESLLKAYQETNYCFAEIVLNIGKISEEAKQILENFSPNGGIFITAWNPFGEIKSDEDNQKANSQLKTDLLAKGLEVISGYGESLDGSWREDSFFAYLVDEELSKDLCQYYQQNAVVYIDNKGLVKLILNPNEVV